MAANGDFFLHIMNLHMLLRNFWDQTMQDEMPESFHSIPSLSSWTLEQEERFPKQKGIKRIPSIILPLNKNAHQILFCLKATIISVAERKKNRSEVLAFEGLMLYLMALSSIWTCSNFQIWKIFHNTVLLLHSI